jgi:hypothetical protein
MEGANTISRDAAAQLVADRFRFPLGIAAGWLEKRLPTGEPIPRRELERAIAEDLFLTKDAAIGLVMQRTGRDHANAAAWLAHEASLGSVKPVLFRHHPPYRLSELEAALVRTAAVASGIQKKAIRDPRGRPPVYDREAAYIEMIRLANSPDGLPDGPSIKRHLKNWFADQDLYPGKTWIDDFVGPFLDRLNAR